MIPGGVSFIAYIDKTSAYVSLKQHDQAAFVKSSLCLANKNYKILPFWKAKEIILINDVNIILFFYHITLKKMLWTFAIFSKSWSIKTSWFQKVSIIFIWLMKLKIYVLILLIKIFWNANSGKHCFFEYKLAYFTIFLIDSLLYHEFIYCFSYLYL